jgi:SsrA-binding protein
VSKEINIQNKKARFNFELSDEFVAGIQLLGTEIKSIRESKASIIEAYCLFKNNELYVRQMYVKEYENGGYFNHEPTRDRKLLLNRIELNKLKKALQIQGTTIVPTKLFIGDKGKAKIRIFVARGKKIHDKRESMKAKDAKREMDRAKKNY